MPFIPADETARIAITYTNNLGNTAVNVIHVQTDEAPITLAVLGGMADVVEDWLASDWADVAGQNWTATNLDLRDLTTATGPVLAREITEAGVLTAENLPSQVTIAISLRTGVAGRSGRGRLYHVGLTESQVTGDYINGATLTALQTAYNNLRLALEAASYFWIVASFYTNGAPRPAAQRRVIQSVTLTDSRVDRQIRRTPDA